MTVPADRTESLLQDLDARFAARRAATTTPDPGPSPDLDPLLRAAAVLHVFDPAQLRPFAPPDGSPPGAGGAQRAALIAVSVRAVGFRHAGLRTLRPGPRQAALRELGTRDAMRAALRANRARTRTTLQRMFERWLSGDPFDLTRMSHAELADLSRLSGWGIAADPGLPPHHLVERARARRSAVAAFEHLVDRDFVGRTGELQRLREHVRGPGRTAGPLLISGAGGAGKTALVGRFLIEQVEGPDADRLPFAYLPFDSETLDVREPFTVLLAITTQLTAQVQATAAAALAEPERAFRAGVADYRDRRGALQRRAADYAARGARITSLSAAEERLYAVFADLVDAASGGDGAPGTDGGTPAPVLLVFDTFEEVVHRAREDLLGFWGMLAFLLDRLPRLRVVITGRTRPTVPDGLASSAVELGDLDEDDATALLVRLGITDPGTARAVARQIGGNPLSIRLAAGVARVEEVGPDGIGGRDGVGNLSVHRIGAELVRGRLYRRLLAHIHDEDVRVLAHAGMVLRRITAEIVVDVLAPACGLVGVDEARSRVLVEGLRREQALVTVAGDGSLRHRAEVRRPVLALLAHDRPTQVRRIHELAVAHHRTAAGPEDRAEELYHRMMLGQDGLDDRWLPGVERYLAPAVDELPPTQRRWLAGRMSIELPPEVYALADVAEWERLVGRKAMEVVRHGGPERVLELLGERTGRTPESPLLALEARALLDLRRPADAAALLDRALARFPALGNPGRLAELLWLRGQAAADDGDRLAFLDQLGEVVAALPSRLAQVQTLTETLDALAPDDPRTGPVRHALAGALGGLTGSEVSAERSLTRLALVRLGPNYPAVLARLAPLVVDDLGYLARRGLVDLEPTIDPVVDGLAAELPELRSLVVPGPAGRDLTGFLNAVVAGLTRHVQRGSGAQPLADAVLTVLRAERATLSSSSLAGIDDYREQWELQATAEVAH